MNNERTIYINEQHLGDGTREQAQYMVTCMKALGWNIAYGSELPHEDYDIDAFEKDWGWSLDEMARDAAIVRYDHAVPIGPEPSRAMPDAATVNTLHAEINQAYEAKAQKKASATTTLSSGGGMIMAEDDDYDPTQISTMPSAETVPQIITGHSSDCYTRRGGVGEYTRPECTEVVTDATGRIILKGALVQIFGKPSTDYRRVRRANGCQVWFDDSQDWVHPSKVWVIW